MGRGVSRIYDLLSAGFPESIMQ
eukprot:COSAG01_NODE_82016_length_107_cov_190.500000_1_plen_22_part_01